MSFRRRTFPEVLDNLLTAITKGVAAESHPFPPPGANGQPYRHSLQQPPASDVVSVYGSRDGQSRLFRKNVDYELLADRQTLQWKPGAELPDDGTLVQVNYYPASAQPILTDIQTGSVVRTLAESVALEIARLHAQLDVVYQSAFIDTATGRALDNVVALLGIERVQGGRPAGEVEFTRSPASRGTIHVPAGTRIITVDGEVEYETTESVTLAEAQNTIRVVARDLEVNDPLPADALTVLPVPIAGIASVTNPAPTTITTRDETDAALRTRAKNFLHGSERATLGAIREAVAKQGITADIQEVQDTPGRIVVTPHAERIPPELQQRLLKAIKDSRPAGVLVQLASAQSPVKVNLRLHLTTAGGLLEQHIRAAHRAVRGKLEDYFARLPLKDAASINRIVGLVLSVAEVEDVRLLNATLDNQDENVLDSQTGTVKNTAGVPTALGELHVADPNLPTRLNVIIVHPADAAPADAPAIRAALTDTLTYLNGANESESVDATRQELSYGKLLRVVPLPDKPGEALEAYDDAVASEGVIPALPSETTIEPYAVQFIFTLESGLSQLLSQTSDASYTLASFERVSLSDVQVLPLDKGE